MRIKRVLSVLLVLSAVTFAGCDVHFDIGKGSGNKKFENKNIKEVDKSFKLSGVNDLKIAIGVSDVNVILTDGDEVKIKGKICDGNDNVISEQNGNTMTISEKNFNNNSWDSDWNITDNNFKFLGNNESKIDISIPKAYKDNIDFKFGAGNVKINDLQVKNISIKCGAGNLNVDNIVFNDFSCKCGAGNFDMSLNKKCGNIDIKGGVGNTKIDLSEVGGNFKLAGGVGNVTVKIPENSPVDIQATGGLGNTNISAKTSSEKKYIFNVTSGVGNVTVK